MNKDTLTLLGIGALAYFVMKGKQSPTASAPFTEGATAAVPTPTGITPEMVQTAQASGLSNADIVNRALNLPLAMQVMSAKGKVRTISTPPPGTTRTSINGNQYLMPRSGGGYRVIGARNIVLNR